MMAAPPLAFLSLAIWLALLFGRGFFWLARERDDRDEPEAPQSWPSVTAVVPARNEADAIARSLESLLAQDYPGSFRVILVDDQSDDDTALAARALGDERLERFWLENTRCHSRPTPDTPAKAGVRGRGRESMSCAVSGFPSAFARLRRTCAPRLARRSFSVGGSLAQPHYVAGLAGNDKNGSIQSKITLEVLKGALHPPGWTGKLFAVSQGVARADAENAPAYLWLTDADIAHAPDNLRRLVARAEQDKLVLVSLMAKLNCESFAGRFLVPAFVFFFALLFPFAWVNDARSRTAAAAGGCMLVRREALERAGGIEAIRGEIIDDCALGRRLKAQGPVWLGLTKRAVSLRPYPRVADIRAMVARSAYAQLGFSPLLLAGAVLGMGLLFVAPLAGLFAGGLAAMAGALAWAAMTVAFQPMLHFYRRSPFWGLALPLIGVFYAAFTIDSAVQYWRGRGGMWKGRAQAIAPT